MSDMQELVRTAEVRGARDASQVEAYLPRNYRVTGMTREWDIAVTLPGGRKVYSTVLAEYEQDAWEDAANLADECPEDVWVHERGPVVFIEGTDDAGWTMDDYVIPRLGSGLIGCRETSNMEGS